MTTTPGQAHQHGFTCGVSWAEAKQFLPLNNPWPNDGVWFEQHAEFNSGFAAGVAYIEAKKS